MDNSNDRKLLVIDCHTGSYLTPEYVPLLRQGGMSAYCLPIGWMKSARNTLDDMAYLFRILEETASDVTMATSAAEIEDAFRGGKIAVIIEFENTLPLDGDLHMIDIFHRLGLRMMQLTYNERNLVGDGCTERTDAGLSDFGIQVIERMNKLGILISLSHTGKRTALEAIQVSQAPVVFSHSNSKALCDHPRNIDDEEIEAVARKGGVIGINAFADFLRRNPTPQNPATIEDFMNNVDYMVRVAGIDHVGIGLDLTEFDAPFTKTGVMSSRNFPPERHNRIFKPEFMPPVDSWSSAHGLESVTQVPDLIQGLRGRGYGEVDVAKIMGLNFLRVFRQVWGS